MKYIYIRVHSTTLEHTSTLLSLKIHLACKTYTSARLSKHDRISQKDTVIQTTHALTRTNRDDCTIPPTTKSLRLHTHTHTHTSSSAEHSSVQGCDEWERIEAKMHITPCCV
jgi:hypothetical protein